MTGTREIRTETGNGIARQIKEQLEMLVQEEFILQISLDDSNKEEVKKDGGKVPT